MEMLIGGRWQPAAGSRRVEEVTSPFDGTVVGTVPVGTVEDVEAALAAAQAGAGRWRRRDMRRLRPIRPPPWPVHTA